MNTASTPLSRRSLLRGGLGIGALALGGPALLSACSSGSGTSAAADGDDRDRLPAQLAAHHGAFGKLDRLRPRLLPRGRAERELPERWPEHEPRHGGDVRQGPRRRQQCRRGVQGDSAGRGPHRVRHPLPEEPPSAFCPSPTLRSARRRTWWARRSVSPRSTRPHSTCC